VTDAVGEVLLDPTVIDLLRLTPDDEHRAWTLFLARPDKTYSYADCTSFVLTRRIRIQQAIALDAEFHHEGFLFPAPSVSCLPGRSGIPVAI
jgi:predicted nucleic acid-binding protein